jgi:hypothetical protein
MMFSLASLAGRSGRGVRIAVIDSGVHAAHPHVNGIAGGVALDADGVSDGDVIDRLGHGTAVAAAIREKAPEAELLAVKVFDRALATTGLALVEAIRWAGRAEAALINLSLGTTSSSHEPALAAAVNEVNQAGAIVVAAAPLDGVRWLPGALPGVIAVELDWECPRDACRVAVEPDGSIRLRASGYPRPIPGVPPSQNMRGASFAVANATGLIALAIEGERVPALAGLMDRLRR